MSEPKFYYSTVVNSKGDFCFIDREGDAIVLTYFRKKDAYSYRFKTLKEAEAVAQMFLGYRVG